MGLWTGSEEWDCGRGMGLWRGSSGCDCGMGVRNGTEDWE